MLDLSQETEALARRLAAAQRLSVDDAIRLALEERARSAGLAPADARRDRQVWRTEEVPEEYIELVRKSEAPKETEAFNGELPEGWTGR
ncbi:MAG: hypothetical protein ACLPX9_22265 [Rhodomicrobium sp.]